MADSLAEDGARARASGSSGLAALVGEERYRRPLLVGMSLMLFQQVRVCGGGEGAGLLLLLLLSACACRSCCSST
jgi:hypothetical protein